MINLSLSLTKSLSYITIWMLSVIPSCVHSVDEHHIKCSLPFPCGNQIDLSYPFWTSGREECGHPDFKVICSDGFAELAISSVKFQILNMNYEDESITLARMDYHNNLCPQYPENVTINLDVLPFSPDTMVAILYYNCSEPRVVFPPNFHIRNLNCEDDIGGQSYFVSSASHSWDRAILDESSASCERNVSIPVSRSALRIEEENPTLENIKKALDKGFELTLNSNCSRCIKSGGACGHNESSRAFVCYCMDKTHEHTCDSEIAKTSLSKPAKLGETCTNKYHKKKYFRSVKTRFIKQIPSIAPIVKPRFHRYRRSVKSV